MKFSTLIKSSIIVLPLLVATACSSTSSSKNGMADNSGANDFSKLTKTEQLQQLATENTVYFDFDKYNIKPDFAKELDQHAEFLRLYPSYNIVIEGHADERGTPEYNIALGERRASAVKAYLQGRGIPANQMSIVSYGKEKPVVLGHDENAYEKNRRAVIVY